MFGDDDPRENACVEQLCTKDERRNASTKWQLRGKSQAPWASEKANATVVTGSVNSPKQLQPRWPLNPTIVWCDTQKSNGTKAPLHRSQKNIQSLISRVGQREKEQTNATEDGKSKPEQVYIIQAAKITVPSCEDSKCVVSDHEGLRDFQK